MSWFKTLKKPRKPSQLSSPSDTAPQTGVRPSSTGARSNRGVESGGVNNGNTPGGDHGTEGRRHGKAKQERAVTSANSPKKPTHESCALKAVLAAVSAIYVHCEETAPVADKLEALISRIIALEELFGTPAGGVVEQKRRDALLRKLQYVEGRFHSLYQRPPPRQLQGGGDVPELLEDLREAIFDYQMTQQTELRAQGHILISSVEAAVLDSFPCSQQAEFLPGSWSGCLKGTRRAVLDEIELWARNLNGSPLYWLNGLARTGKTAIAQTIAERAFADGELGASFICSRDYEARSNPHLIFPTLAVQLARKYADFRSFFIPLVQSNPGIAYESLDNQMQKLIIQPLQESNVSTLVIIDALDECRGGGSSSAILSVLAQFLSDIPKVKFLITARPETHIREGFRLPLLEEATSVFVLHEVEKSQVDNDIRLFLRHGLSGVVRLGGSNFVGLLSERELDVLCTLAAGSFIYAVAAIKFINPQVQSSNPMQRFNLLLESSRRTIHETKTKPDEDWTLDWFHELILQGTFPGRHDPENDRKICAVLGAIAVAANPLSPSTVATLLGLDCDEVLRLLSLARPLLIPQKDTHTPIFPLHKPFPSFIVSPMFMYKRFLISPSDHHTRLLMGCLKLMILTLEGNMCQLPDGAANEDIGDLRQRIERYIDPALIYACRSWHLHLIYQPPTLADTPGITFSIRQFLETKFLFWLEVLSVLGAAKNAVDALQAVADWLKESPILDLVNDCTHFVTSYFEIISESSPHIYHSALVITPKSSIVRKLYEAHARPFTRVVCGLPTSWDSATLATGCSFRVKLVVWSPCNKYLAISPPEPVTVAVLDATALRQAQNLEFSPRIPSRPLAFIFSPDSRVLTCSCAGLCSDEELCVTSWDVRTGRIVSAIEHRRPKAFLKGKPFITYSTDGGTVGILYRYRSSAVISIYNVVSGIYLYDVPHDVHSDPGGLRFYDMWTHGRSLRFATAESTTITIREVGFHSSSTPRKVATLHVPENVHHTDVFGPISPDVTTCAQFLPTSRRLALTRFVGPALQILVWDPRDTEPRLNATDSRFRPPLSLSSGGHFLACSSVEPEIYLWKESSIGYVLAAKLPSSTQHPSSLLSANGESIVVYDDSTIRLWYTNAFTAPTTTTSSFSSSRASTQAQQSDNFVLDFHPFSLLAAFSRRKGGTATILDLKSGLPQLVISTGVGVVGIKVVENTVVAIGDGKVVTWKLSEANCLPGATIGLRDGPQMTLLNDERQTSAVTASISFGDLLMQCILEKKQPLYAYSASTGRCVGYALVEGITPWFAQGKLDIWCTVGDKAEMWMVTPEGLSESVQAQAVDGVSLELPWVSSCGYQATKYGWILSPDGKRLLMLPPYLRSDAVAQLWRGQYLALLHGSLPEPAILEFGP